MQSGGEICKNGAATNHSVEPRREPGSRTRRIGCNSDLTFSERDRAKFGFNPAYYAYIYLATRRQK